jgi:hypothetical protein
MGKPFDRNRKSGKPTMTVDVPSRRRKAAERPLADQFAWVRDAAASVYGLDLQS